MLIVVKKHFSRQDNNYEAANHPKKLDLVTPSALLPMLMLRKYSNTQLLRTIFGQKSA